jgi:hypothetical protein
MIPKSGHRFSMPRSLPAATSQPDILESPVIPDEAAE